MPKIFVLRHQLAEQQAKLRQHDKSGENSSPPLSSDEEAAKEAIIIEERPEILQRPPPGLVIQPIPPPVPTTSTGREKNLCLTYLSQFYESFPNFPRISSKKLDFLRD